MYKGNHPNQENTKEEAMGLKSDSGMITVSKVVDTNPGGWEESALLSRASWGAGGLLLRGSHCALSN